MISPKIFLSAIFTLFSFMICKGQSNNCLEMYSYYDSTSIKGNFIKYRFKNNLITLEYGNKSLDRTLPCTFECHGVDAWIPHFIWDNDDFIVLKYGCGSPCWGIWVLPLNSTDPARNIMYNLAFDTKKNLVAYLDNNEYKSLIVENLKTKKRQVVEFPFKSDHGEFLGYWIEDINFREGTLDYKYSNPNDPDNRKTFEIKIEINL